jgi:cytidylate kinase
MNIATDRGLEALGRLREYLDARLYEHQEGQARNPVGKAPPPLTIALSRQAGSGGADIAKAVGASLGWPVYDHELLDRIAEEKGLSTKVVEQLDERHGGWLEEAVRAFCLTEGSKDGVYLRGLLGQLVELGKQGHCVIVGRGAAQVLPDESTLAVRIIAPRSDRVARIARSKGLSAADAERWVEQHDAERLRFVKHHFHVDAADPMLYDLVLNSKRFSVEECAVIIVQLARALEAHRQPPSRAR